MDEGKGRRAYVYTALAIYLAVFAGQAAADEDPYRVVPDGLGGFKVYSEDGTYLERIIPNDWGGYDRRAMDGERTGVWVPQGDGLYDLRNPEGETILEDSPCCIPYDLDTSEGE